MNDPEQSGLNEPRGRRWDDRFTFLSLGRLEMNESAAVFGLIACLILFALALASDIAYGLSVLYAFPIGLSAWLFGRWVGAAVGVFAVVSFATVGVVQRQSLGQVAVVVLALVLVTLVSIVATEWARRSERLVRLLNQRELRHRQMIDTMTKVGQELVASKRWEVIADYMMSSLVRDLGLDSAWMFHRDTSGPETRLVLLASAGDAPAIASVEPGGGAPGWVLRNGRMVLARSRRELLEREPDLELTPLEEVMQAILALPVVVKGATAGVVMLGSRPAPGLAQRRRWHRRRACQPTGPGHGKRQRLPCHDRGPGAAGGDQSAQVRPSQDGLPRAAHPYDCPGRLLRHDARRHPGRYSSQVGQAAGAGQRQD